MARYTGPKHRLARREGVNILDKSTGTLEKRLNVPPGVHGRKGTRKPSEYGLQLREKQQLKRSYGLLEKQFRKYVEAAVKSSNATDGMLVQYLESRLDNAVFRLGFAKTRTQARQFVGHGHVLVNGEKVNIPSYQLQVGDEVSIKPKISNQELMVAHLASQEENIVSYFKREGTVGKLVRKPNREDALSGANYQLVIEFYSR